MAILWRVLEEHDIASPRLEVTSDGSGLMALHLAFDKTGDAERVQRALCRLMPAIELNAVPRLVGAIRARSDEERATMSIGEESDPPPSGPENEEMGGLSPGLRHRLTDRIERLTVALDAAEADPSPETFDDLREAADQLMRATGRILVEVPRP